MLELGWSCVSGVEVFEYCDGPFAFEDIGDAVEGLGGFVAAACVCWGRVVVSLILCWFEGHD